MKALKTKLPRIYMHAEVLKRSSSGLCCTSAHPSPPGASGVLHCR